MATVGAAIELARDWVRAEAAALPGFAGAYVAGSAVWRHRGAELPGSSDVDVMVLVDPPPAAPAGKRRVAGVLLDVTFVPPDRLGPPAAVLARYQLAGAFRAPVVLADATGALTALAAAVARGFAEPRWVEARCRDAEAQVRAGLAALDPAAPWHDAVLGWLFATGKTAHVLLTAARRNPTVRRRYVDAGELLAEHGRSDLHERLLAALGCDGLAPEAVEACLAELEPVFDAAVDARRTPQPFASDLTVAARPVAIDGGRELVAAGRHREAAFWIAVTWSRCRAVLAADAPALLDRCDPGYAALLDALGVGTPSALHARARTTLDGLLPEVVAAATTLRA